jgi:hypothetical protein
MPPIARVQATSAALFLVLRAVQDYEVREGHCHSCGSGGSWPVGLVGLRAADADP